MDRRALYITIVVSVLLHAGALVTVAVTWGSAPTFLQEPQERVVAVVPPPPPPPPPPPLEVEDVEIQKPRFRPRPVPPPPAPVRQVKAVPLKPQPPAESTSDATTIVVDKPVPAAPPAASSSPPRAASKPPPTYPRRALDAEKEGVVRIRITIQPDGAVSDASIVAARPEGWFENAALSAVKTWRYESSGHVRTTIVEVEFKLE